MKQRELALMAALVKAKYVEPEIVHAWNSYRDAALWAFKNRTHAELKPVKWFAQALGMRESHVSRFLRIGDVRLGLIHSWKWDRLTGWSALEQWAEAEKQRIAEDASKQITEAFKGARAACP